MALTILIFMLCCLGPVLCVNVSVVFPLGPCPNYKIHPGFDSQLAFGKWYGIVYATEAIHEVPVCHEAFFRVNPSGALSIVFEFKFGLATFPFSIKGLPDGIQSGKWTARLSFETGITQSVTILSTDYDNYMSLVQCKNNGNKDRHVNFALVLSRRRTLSNEFFEKAAKSIADAGIDAPFHVLPQTGCRYP